jgi:hypothetical protein
VLLDVHSIPNTPERMQCKCEAHGPEVTFCSKLIYWRLFSRKSNDAEVDKHLHWDTMHIIHTSLESYPFQTTSVHTSRRRPTRPEDTLKAKPVRNERQHVFRSSTKRRAAWACLPCRKRKVRCNVTMEQPCLNCKHDGFECYLSFCRSR